MVNSHQVKIPPLNQVVSFLQVTIFSRYQTLWSVFCNKGDFKFEVSDEVFGFWSLVFGEGLKISILARRLTLT